MKRIVFGALFLVGILIGGCTTFENQPVFTTQEGAIRGYDPVSYFNGSPQKGKTEFSYKWKGSNWYFASEENLKKFIANPGKFSPQYGGYCSYAMRDGKKYEIDPEAWTIKDGRLYLNLSQKVNRFWRNNLDDNIIKANESWKTHYAEEWNRQK